MNILETSDIIVASLTVYSYRSAIGLPDTIGNIFTKHVRSLLPRHAVSACKEGKNHQTMVSRARARLASSPRQARFT